jgi:hypothetical protein
MADSPYFIGPAMLANAGKHYPRGVRPKLAAPLLREMYMFCSLFAICSFLCTGRTYRRSRKIPLVLTLGDKPKQIQAQTSGRRHWTNMSLGKAEIVRLFLAQARALRDKRKPRPAQEKGNTYLKLISGAGDCGPHIVLPRRLKVSGGWC